MKVDTVLIPYNKNPIKTARKLRFFLDFKAWCSDRIRPNLKTGPTPFKKPDRNQTKSPGSGRISNPEYNNNFLQLRHGITHWSFNDYWVTIISSAPNLTVLVQFAQTVQTVKIRLSAHKYREISILIINLSVRAHLSETYSLLSGVDRGGGITS